METKTNKLLQFLSFFLVLFLLVGQLAVFQLIPNVKANPDWLAGWDYRKSHVINNATGAETNYQIRIKAHYRSDNDTVNGEYSYLGEIISKGASGEWDADKAWVESIIWDDATNKYWLCYHNNDDGIGLAYSTNIEGPYTKHSNNPILENSTSGWDSGYIQNGWLFKHGSYYYIIYEGSSDATWSNFKLGLAWTDDIESGTWTKSSNNPIFDSASSGWDSERVGEPSVVWDGSKWVLFYMGTSSGAETEQIGYATTTVENPQSWTTSSWTRYSGNPVISPRSNKFDKDHTADPSVYYEDGTYYILYTGCYDHAAPDHGYVGVYKTTDLENFVCLTSNPTLVDEDGELILKGTLYKTSDYWYIFYCTHGTTASESSYLARCSIPNSSNDDLVTSETTVTESGHYSNYGCDNAKDEDEFVGWVADAENAWIKFDLGSTKTINKLQWMRSGYDTGRVPKNFTIEVSTDGSSWTTVKTITNNARLGQNLVFSSTEARYVKIDISATSDGNGASIGEVRIFGQEEDSGEDVYLNQHCRTDFGDVRFTKSDGTTELDYWMEKKVDSDYAVFWIEVADDLSSSDVTIYIYYGKSDATTTSNGANTFIAFDDFEDYNVGDSPSSSKGWTVDSGDPEIVNNPTGRSGKGLQLDNINTRDTIYNDWTTKYSGVAVHFWWRIDGLDLRNGYYSLREDDTSIGHVQKADGNEQWYSGSAYQDFSPSLSYSANTWHEYEYRLINNNNFHVTQDETDHDGGFWNTPTNGANRMYFDTYQAGSYSHTYVIDDFYVRKYVSPEPSHGSWGTEEEEQQTEYSYTLWAANMTQTIMLKQLQEQFRIWIETVYPSTTIKLWREVSYTYTQTVTTTETVTYLQEHIRIMQEGLSTTEKMEHAGEGVFTFTQTITPSESVTYLQEQQYILTETAAPTTTFKHWIEGINVFLSQKLSTRKHFWRLQVKLSMF